MISNSQTACTYNLQPQGAGKAVLVLSGHLDVDNTGRLFKKLHADRRLKKQTHLTVDLEQVDYLDDFGALLLNNLKDLFTTSNRQITLTKASPKIRAILKLADFEGLPGCELPQRRKRHNLLIRLGDATIRNADHLRYMISFLGSVILCFLHVFAHPRAFRKDDAFDHMEKTGVDAIPIVALISFLMGLIIAFVSSVQLRQFGANVYVASLVALSMVSELGPIMTAIVVSGRSGSAFAAEIGTMKINEEVDALFSMGFNPTLFLAIPRIVAALIVVPILTLIADLFAIFGGLVVGVFMLDLTATTYMSKTLESLTLFEVLWGLSKSAVFAVIIAWVGCLRGFQARGGASSVGNAATSAVVTSIFLIILFDSIFAVIRTYW